MEKDYYVEMLRAKQLFARTKRMDIEEISKLKARLQYYQRENYELKRKLREVNAVDQAHNYNQVLDNVCQIFDITIEDLKGKRRFRHLILARHIAIYIIRNEFNLPLKKIGAIFVVDHSSVIHACKQIQNIIDSPQFHKDEYHYYLKCKGI